jgi:hypothetical protein
VRLRQEWQNLPKGIYGSHGSGDKSGELDVKEFQQSALTGSVRSIFSQCKAVWRSEKRTSLPTSPHAVFPTAML